ncbi:MAG TPA: sulfatase [Verrucomicrobiae bacterium]|nr:sulfatase [Verrucomicrobiae bacterium]
MKWGMATAHGTTRRDFLKTGFGAASAGIISAGTSARGAGIGGGMGEPNLVYVFSDQWRWCDHGYEGNREVATPRIDGLARESVNFRNAVSCMPVCSPHRASLITGQYPLTHGLFINDLSLNDRAVSFAQALDKGGYETGYVGKWHIDGRGRTKFTPPERRKGFKFWRAMECTHAYNKSEYFGDDPEQKKVWPGYDAYAQTDEAVGFLRARAADKKKFALFLSWGPPHDPYRTGPPEILARYDARSLTLRPNVPEALRAEAQKTYAGYYTHIEALDQCVGRLLDALRDTGLGQNTIFIYTSDHGDMLHSQGLLKKQKPWDESLRVPLLVRCPAPMAVAPRDIQTPINTPDIMPTVLSLCGVPVPSTAEGEDFSPLLVGRKEGSDSAALIMCPSPFGEWTRAKGGKEYRGVRTVRYTYVRDLEGPWLLYDNAEDPFQQRNLVADPAFAKIRADLEERLRARLAQTGDEFLPGPELIRRCGYKVDANDTVPSTPPYFNQVTVPCRKG